MARANPTSKWLVVFCLLAGGCTGPGQGSLWPFWAQGPGYHSSIEATTVDMHDAQGRPVGASDAGVRQAAAEEPSDPPGVAQASAEEPLDPPRVDTAEDSAGEVMYADPILRRGHVLR